MRICTVPDCDRPHVAKGYCRAHYYRVKRHGDPQAHIPIGQAKLKDPGPCEIESCARMAFARGMCKAHYGRRRRGDVRAEVPIGDPVAEPPVVTLDPVGCSIEGCERPSEARGWCHSHYMRWVETDEPLRRTARAACSVEGCGRPVTGRGMCRRHYQAWQRRPSGTEPER